MKSIIKIKENQNTDDDKDDLLPEYDFDYSKAKPNRFAHILAEQNGYIKCSLIFGKYSEIPMK